MCSNSLFDHIMIDEKLSQCIIKYLSYQNIVALLLSSKKLSYIISFNLFKNDCYNNSNFIFSFYYQNYFELLNSKTIKNIWLQADSLYKRFYSQSHFANKCFYFAFIVLGVDLSTFLVACVKLKKNLNFIYQIPMIFNWIISLVLCIVYILRYNNLKKTIKHLIKKSIVDNDKLYSDEKAFLAKKLKLRTKHKQPLAFLQVSLIFIIFYFPILVKTCMERVSSSYRKALWASSSLIFLYMLFRKLYKIIKKKLKYRKDKLYQYKKLYSFIFKENQFYNKTITRYHKNEKESKCGEGILFFQFFFSSLVGYLIFLFYLDALGAKLDNPEESLSWFVLFSPAYIVLFFIIVWGILYCYSICKYNMIYKKRLCFTIIFIVLGLIGNVVIIPLMLEDRINISKYWPFGIFCFISILIFYNYYLLRKQKKILNKKRKF